MMRVKLKAIMFNVDFRKSELTNLNEFRQSDKFPGDLEKNEAFLFVSKSGNQLVFILNDSAIETGTGTIRKVVDSRKWRMDGNSFWEPKMLQNYANEVGIELVGFRRLEDTYKKTYF